MPLHRFAATAILLASLAACGGGGGDDAAPADSAASPPAQATDTTPAPSAPASRQSWVLDQNGIGPIRVGMTTEEARAALGGDFSPQGEEACQYVLLAGEHPGVAVMLENGRVVRVEVDSGATATSLGARIGDTEARVRELYPDPRVMPHKYTAGKYLVAIPGAPADTLRRVVFETDSAGTVTRFRGGTAPAVEYVEGCS